MTQSQYMPAWRPAIALVFLLVAGCGDQVVIEGVDVKDDSLVGDSVIDTTPEATGSDEGYATGDPYEEAVEGEKNMGPNAPGYIPETID